MELIFVYLLVVNVLAFCVYGLDKLKAKHGSWRIPEKTLLIVALIGGSVGAFAGMQVFRHKTKHAKFVIGIPLILILQIAIIWFILNK